MRIKTLVIGLGNPILGDDGVGWKVAEEIKSRIGPSRPDIEVDYASLGGLSLMERMLGYERVILVDSIASGNNETGSVLVFPLSDLADPTAGHSGSTHDTSLLTALETAQTMGMNIPKMTEVVAIEINATYDFSDSLSPDIAKAVPIAVQKIMDLLNQDLT